MKNDILANLLKSKGIDVTPELLAELDEAAKQQARDNAETLNAMKVDNFHALQETCKNLHSHIKSEVKNADILPGSAFNVV
jgi:ribose 1,5-bisphosphokinase PhnN